MALSSSSWHGKENFYTEKGFFFSSNFPNEKGGEGKPEKEIKNLVWFEREGARPELYFSKGENL